MPRAARSWAGIFVMSSPWNTTRPPVGWRRPLITFSVVDFPAPFGPMRTVAMPSFASSPMSRRTRVPSSPAVIPSRRSTAGLRSQIGLDYCRILDDLLRRSLRDLRAFLHHDDVLRHRQDRSHHMLDDEGSESQFPLQAREQSDRIAEFVRRESGEDLIEEEDPRAGRENPSEFESLPLLNRQARRADVLLARQPNEAEDLPRGLP